ncbi:MAG: type II secretion system F family protein [Candidatus Sumerlaeia bacterium]|nr:type II secretion system F family protein [Candidatus Sumerlaeia bacterium]
MLVVAIPRFEQVYKEQAAQLPGVTRIILAVSHFVQDYPLIYVPLLIVAIVLLIAYGRTPVGRRMYDWLKLQLPIMGPINVKINVARFTRTVGGLLAAGIPLLEALNVAFRTAENVVVAEAIKQTHDNVERGGKMDEPLRKNPVFPPLVVDMIAIGDEAGALDTMLNKIADVYETDVDASLKGLTALIEPLLIVFLGFVVIFIALGLLLPYWNLVRVIGEK